MSDVQASKPANVLHIPDVYKKSPNDLLKDLTAEVLAAGAYIFAYAKGETNPRLLIIQREPGDGSMANKWEIPGGGCEDGDDTVIHVVAREVLEEVGLHVVSPVHKVLPDNYFHSRSGLHVVKMDFEVQIAEATEEVVLETIPVLLSHEHQQFAWATKEEVADEQKYPMTSIHQRTQALEAFRLHLARRK